MSQDELEQAARRALSEVFGHTEFRPAQWTVIRAVLGGDDVFAVLPTGAGKSLCYQLPAAILPGTFLVISPLIALMKDQVDALRERGKVRAAYINSSLSLAEQKATERHMQAGEYDLVYVAPERLRSARFREALERCPLARVVVDEAHCISEWGHDFRPDYLHIGDVFSGNDRPPFLALTATATPRVRGDVLARLGIADAGLVALSVDRPNLRWQVRHTPTEEAKLAAVAELLRELTQGSAIVYCGTRQNAEDVAEFIRSRGLACEHYHAGLTSQQRTDVQERFMSDEMPVVAATNAFGMGIDKEDIRFVIHHRMPGTLEAYYQEAGRAGRDGQPSDCVLLYAAEDRRLQEYFIENEALTPADTRKLWPAMQEAASDDGEEPDWLRLDAARDSLEAVLNFSETRVRCGIEALHVAGAVRQMADERGMLRVLLRRGPLDGDMERRAHAVTARRRKVRHEQLSAMIRYAENPMCRRQQLVGYFGDARAAKTEPCCDVCDAKTDGPAEITEMEWRILATVAGLRFPLGRVRVADVVWGSRSKELLNWGLDQHPQYGALHGTPKKTIIAAIDQVVARGLLVVRGSDKPVLHLTEAGRRALEAAPAPERRPEPPKAPPGPRPDGDPDIPSEDVERLILACVKSTRHGVGRHLLAATLCGGRGKKIEGLRLAETPQYGRLAGLRRKDVVARIDDMIERGLLAIDAARWSVLVLTQAGRARLGRHPRLPSTQPTQPPQTPAPEEPSDAEAAARFLSEAREAPIAGPHLDGGVSLDVNSRFVGSDWKYTGLGGQVLQYKYRRRTDLVRPLADRLEKAINAHPELNACDVIVPVPPSDRDRSHQPVFGLAKALHAYHGRHVVLEALLKSRQTQKQKDMETMPGKRENVHGAFHVAQPELIRGRRVLLLDDFVDSGETLNECARVLKAAGAKAVYAITLVRTIHHAAGG